MADTNQAGAARLCNLPVEVLHNVSRHLSLQARKQLSLTSRPIREKLLPTLFPSLSFAINDTKAPSRCMQQMSLEALECVQDVYLVLHVGPIMAGPAKVSILPFLRPFGILLLSMIQIKHLRLHLSVPGMDLEFEEEEHDPTGEWRHPAVNVLGQVTQWKELATTLLHAQDRNHREVLLTIRISPPQYFSHIWYTIKFSPTLIQDFLSSFRGIPLHLICQQFDLKVPQATHDIILPHLRFLSCAGFYDGLTTLADWLHAVIGNQAPVQLEGYRYLELNVEPFTRSRSKLSRMQSCVQQTTPSANTRWKRAFACNNLEGACTTSSTSEQSIVLDLGYFQACDMAREGEHCSLYLALSGSASEWPQSPSTLGKACKELRNEGVEVLLQCAVLPRTTVPIASALEQHHICPVSDDIAPYIRYFIIRLGGGLPLPVTGTNPRKLDNLRYLHFILEDAFHDFDILAWCISAFRLETLSHLVLDIDCEFEGELETFTRILMILPMTCRVIVNIGRRVFDGTRADLWKGKTVWAEFSRLCGIWGIDCELIVEADFGLHWL